MRRIIDRYFHDERDMFVALFGLFLIVSYFFSIPTAPFRFGSLVVVFLFFATTRSFVNNLNSRLYSYILIGFIGLICSIFLSPYGTIIYFIVATLIYTKTKLI